MPRLLTCALPLLLMSAGANAASARQDSAPPIQEAFKALIESGPLVPASGPAPDRSRYLATFEEPTPQVESRSRPKTVVISSDRAAPSDSGQSSGWVPPGFEELLEPQTTVVDVYYGGQYLLSTPATFTPTDLSFLDPESIVSQIPDLLEPGEIATTLGNDMPTNSELACINQRNPDCGKIETEQVDIIFDEAQFRADLFINPALLAVRSAVASRFLPRSSAGWSLLNATSATVNGAEGDQTNFNLGNSTTVAWRENRLVGVSSVTRDSDLTFDTLALQREFRGQQIQGGIFRSSPGTLVFLSQADYQGVSIASSLDTRQDLDQSAGNELQVFLDSRSRVDIIKDGRLISTAVYDTGNQIIDTSQLPGGAYEVTLRIQDGFGTIREETRFYVKTNRLPPLDQPLYFFDFGETVEKIDGEALPSGTGERFVRAGYAKRLTPNFGGEIGVRSAEDASVFESGLFKLGRSYELRVNAAVGTDDSHGISSNARTRIGTATLSGSVRQIWSDNPNSIIGSELTQASFNLTMPIGRASINLTGRYNDRPSGVDRNIGIRYDFGTRRFGQSLFNANLQVTKNNGDWQVLVGGRLSIRSGRWQTRVTSRVFRDRRESEPDDSGLISDVTSTWQDGDLYPSDINLIFRANDGQVDRSLESELDVTAGLGRANLELIYSDDAQRLSYGGSFYTSLIANPDTIAVGARQQGQSAVVLDIGGANADAYFDVEVNGLRRGTALIGDRTVIGLPPFQTYEVRLRSQGNAIIDFEQRAQQATLYPGNVVTMNWTVAKVVIAFGQIVDEDGSPIANAVLDGVLGLATTDEFGLFQAEFNSDVEALTARTREQTCEVLLPEYDASQMVVTLGELVCRVNSARQ